MKAAGSVIAGALMFCGGAMAQDAPVEEVTAESPPASAAPADDTEPGDSGEPAATETRPTAPAAPSSQPATSSTSATGAGAKPDTAAAPDTLPSTIEPSLPVLADIGLQHPDALFRFAAQAELGILLVASHTLQFGNEGTPIDYVRDGGQDSLFPFTRVSADVTIADHHHLVFLYQPLTLETNVSAERQLRVYDTIFDEGTPLRLKYGFDFVRASYLYDFLPSPEHELSIGASLQLRNAIIDFAGGNGDLFVASRNVGPVPILKARWRYTFENAAFVGAEVDGFYANIPIANGDLESSVQGAIWDASLRAGVPMTGFSNLFLNVRYLGGGSEGTEVGGDDVDGDGYADNWLHTVVVSLGFELR